jgi:hypothetical protein
MMLQLSRYAPPPRQQAQPLKAYNNQRNGSGYVWFFGPDKPKLELFQQAISKVIPDAFYKVGEVGVEDFYGPQFASKGDGPGPDNVFQPDSQLRELLMGLKRFVGKLPQDEKNPLTCVNLCLSHPVVLQPNIIPVIRSAISKQRDFLYSEGGLTDFNYFPEFHPSEQGIEQYPDDLKIPDGLTFNYITGTTEESSLRKQLSLPFEKMTNRQLFSTILSCEEALTDITKLPNYKDPLVR